MEKKFKRTTVTSALPYANGPVHIGHLAGVYVPADIYVRYLRLKKEDVLFIGGSDEHGVPITIRAKKEGCAPQDIVDRYHTLIRDSFKEFGISFDVYGRTSSEVHHKTASDFFRTLYDKGEFIEKTSMQYYDEEAKTFLADRYITGECPRCHAEGARRSIRRPMREVRLHSFAYGTYQSEECHQRKRTRNERNQALVSAPRQARSVAAPMDIGRPQRVAS